ncbi:sugar ABC transporter permease [candidate division KSB1 bacterium]|nr:sugar ABC transporter permease [candidate division KSB1 bacterium]
MARINRKKIKEAASGYAFASPWLIGFMVFTLGPMLFSLYLSFTDWNLLKKLDDIRLIGFDNYVRIFSHDPRFWISLENTAFYTFFSVPLGIIGALLLALLLNQQVKGIALFRTIFYLPSVVSGVATAVLWMWVFNPQFGIVNSMLRWFGIEGPGWLIDPNWSKPTLIIMSLWRLGGSMLIYLAGLQNIPDHLYEAADLDGANRLQKFWNVTIPSLTPTIFFNLVMSIIGSFQVFTTVYIISDGAGSPQQSTLFYVLYLYKKAFQEYEMGYASALAWILFVIILFFTLLIIKSSALWVYYEGERR